MNSYLDSIKQLPNQLNQSYQETLRLKFPSKFKKSLVLVVGGMGGSQLPADILKHSFSANLNLPLVQVKGYKLPRFVNQQSLVLLFSYSGNTEEVLELFKAARQKKAMMMAVGSGGSLLKLAKQSKIPFYKFNPHFNPSGQPRLGTGYFLGFLLAFLRRLKKLNLSDKQFKAVVKASKTTVDLFTRSNQVKNFAQRLKGRLPIIVASEFLQGNIHLMANQLNESAKQLAIYYSLPELNHHLLEGLSFPKDLKKKWHFIFVESADYHRRNRLRFRVTQEILKKQKISYSQISFRGEPLNQALAMIVFGGLVSFELAKLNKVDPNLIPWVDHLKNRLAK